ncbi:MAG: hypothetical protein QF364_07360 [Candidatus Poseidoniaceae archaeon]|jgi:hypothetical protein|nr:hypothetical protein [Candidatus Poseidoniaceae archaeon]|tara:strand:+ start:493 stop:963 length:471 start_codon:yes stop_codon:yes gene_type:complete
MPNLRYFGRGGAVLEHLQSKGWTVVDSSKKAEIMVVETFDNKKGNTLERLQSTVELMRNALDEIEQHQLQSFIVITDSSSVSGNPRQRLQTHDGACLNGVHGFGSLTAETLARKAAQIGICTRVLRIADDTEKIQNLDETLNSLDFSVSYRLIQAV